MTSTRSRTETLWILTVPPVIWAAHLLLSYITAAIYCEKVSSGGSLDGARVAIAAYTGAALIGNALSGVRGWRWHREGLARPDDTDSPEERRRFLGFATFLLSTLSAVAVVFLATSVAIVGTCR